MIQMQTILDVADNSGAKKAMCIKVLGGSHRMIANVGDIIVLSIKEAIPRGKVKKGEVRKGLIVRTKKGVKRADGSTVTFSTNAVVILKKNSEEPEGTAVFGPIPRELRAKNFTKIVSLAKEVV